MESEKEIFNKIALAIIDIIPQGEAFNSAVLEIKRLTNNVGYNGYYFIEGEIKKWMDIFSFDLDSKIIEHLYEATQTKSPIHTDWNRAIFTLFPNNKFKIEYIWDQALQDEVDKYNDSII